MFFNHDGIDGQVRGFLIVLALALGFGAVPRPASAGDPEPTLVWSLCPLELIPTQQLQGRGIECGTLTVPEVRGSGTGRTVQVAVARIPARWTGSRQDPVLYLHGGPGGWALDDLPHFGRHLLNESFEIWLMDQRGSGRSKPWPCPELSRRAYAADPDADLVSACLEELRGQGVDPAAFTIEEIAADVQDLRRLMGRERLNLFGESFGTMVAQHLMLTHPETVRAAVLDAVVPLDWRRSETVDVLARVLDLKMQRCAADAACNAAYPELKTRFFDAIAALEAAEPGRGAEAVWTIHQLLYAQLFHDAVPFLMDAVARRRTGPLDAIGTLLETALGPLSIGATIAVNCARFDTAAEAAMMAEMASRHPTIPQGGVAEFGGTCEAWPVRRAQLRPATMAAPVLILQGELDPVTPPAFGERLLPFLTDGRLIVLEGASHGAVRGTACGAQAADRFLRDLGAFRTPDACAVPQPVRFATAALYDTSSRIGASPSALTAVVGVFTLIGLSLGGTIGAVLLFAGERRSWREHLARPAMAVSAGLVLAGVHQIGLIAATMHASAISPVMPLFGIPMIWVPVLALPWLALAAGVWAVARWVRHPDLAPAGRWNRIALGLGLAVILSTLWQAAGSGLLLGL